MIAAYYTDNREDAVNAAVQVVRRELRKSSHIMAIPSSASCRSQHSPNGGPPSPFRGAQRRSPHHINHRGAHPNAAGPFL
jgi:hypothetical protein